MRSSKRSLFLMELILSILFFSLTGAICLQLFVKAHLISESTINLNHSVAYAQNLAEVFVAKDGDISSLPSVLSEYASCMTATDHSFSITYDENWMPLAATPDTLTVYYVIQISYADDDSKPLRKAVVLATRHDAVKGDSEIYSLNVSKYVKGGTAS